MQRVLGLNAGTCREWQDWILGLNAEMQRMAD
jgi:hypothetical protein